MTVQHLHANNEMAVQSSHELEYMLFNDKAMEQMYKVAEIMASGKATVPTHLQGNTADCLAIVMQAAQWRMNPFPVAQKTHVVSGTLGYEAQLVNAVITTMAPTKDRLHFEWFGAWEKVVGKFVEKQGQKGNYKAPAWTAKDEEGLGVRVWATLKGEDEPRVLELLLTQAQVRNSTLWAGDPKQQLAYLAIKRWSRLYCPDVIMGVYTPDELQELPEREINPMPTQSAAPKKHRVFEDAEAVDAEQAEPAPQTKAQPEPETQTNPFMQAEPEQEPMELSLLLEILGNSKNRASLDEWKTLASAWPAGTPVHDKLMQAYQAHIATLKPKAAE